MRNLRAPALSLALALLATTAALAAVSIGQPAPSFTLTDVAGKSVSLADFKGKTVVLEWMNPNCPFSIRHSKEKTMTGIAAKHPDIVFLAINSTRRDHKDYLEPQAYQKILAEHAIGYPVLYDASGEVGRAYAAKTTPHMFVIDKTGKLVYDGAIDDQPSGGNAARTNYVDKALADLAAGRAVAVATTKPYGCTVKY